MYPRSKAPFAIAAIVLLSCSEHQPAAPAKGTTLAPSPAAPTTSLERLRCTGRITSKTVSCARPSSDVQADLIVGSQGTYVQLTSANVSYNSGTSIFSFDVTVQNLIPQALGTVDGTTGDPAGVQVFFTDPPVVTAGSGAISVANADGQGTFTGTNQDFFAYTGTALGADGLLSTNEISLAKTWQLSVAPGVDSFEFWVYVNAKVRYPNGYVDATAPSPYLNQTSTQTVTATSRTVVGNAVPGSTISYASSAPAVATVNSATGQITGVAPGVATINVTSTESTTGSVTVQVCPNLALGEVYSTSGSSGLDVCLGGGGSVQEYTMLPMNTDASSSISLTVKGTGIQAVTGPPTPDRLPQGASRAGLVGDEAGSPIASFGQLTNTGARVGDPESSGIPHDALLRLHMRAGRAASRGSVAPDEELPPDAEGVIAADGATQRLRWYSSRSAERSAAAEDYSGGGEGVALASTAPPDAVVGDLVQYNTNSACSGSPSIRTGRVASISNFAVIVADTANPAGGFTTAQYDSIGLEFDTIAYPTVVNNFGASTDLDVNGRIILFFTRALNELSPPAVLRSAAFYSKDVFGTDDCSNSNGTATTGVEILYAIVPDIAATVNSAARSVVTTRSVAVLTLGHELQHLVNGMRRAYVTGASFFEEGWLDEALSSATEELMFYRASGMVPRSNVGPGTNAVSGVQLNSKRVAAYNAYESQQISNIRTWLQRPDTAGLTGSPSASLARRGFGGTFLRYAADRLNSGDAAFFYSLVNSNVEGLSNVQNAIGGATPYDWIRDYEIALYSDDVVSMSVAARYTAPSWNYRALLTLLFGSYSLGTRPLSNGVNLTLLYKPGGAVSYVRFGVPSSAFARITSTTATSAPFRFSWLRTK